jgi:hypothetical protein
LSSLMRKARRRDWVNDTLIAALSSATNAPVQRQVAQQTVRFNRLMGVMGRYFLVVLMP